MYSFASRTYDGQEADYADGQSHKQNTCAVVAVVSTGLSFLTLDECTECTNNFNSLSGEPGQTLLVFRVAFTIFLKLIQKLSLARVQHILLKFSRISFCSSSLFDLFACDRVGRACAARSSVFSFSFCLGTCTMLQQHKACVTLERLPHY